MLEKSRDVKLSSRDCCDASVAVAGSGNASGSGTVDEIVHVENLLCRRPPRLVGLGGAAVLKKRPNYCPNLKYQRIDVSHVVHVSG